MGSRVLENLDGVLAQILAEANALPSRF